MISAKYKKVYILGSGFSKSVSSKMPILSELSDSLMQLDDISSFPELTGFIKNVASLAGQNKDLTSIEKLSSIILSKGLFYNAGEKVYFSILKHQLLRWIFEQIEVDAPQVDSEKREGLVRFFKKCSSDTDPSLVISFNYDLLIERLLLNSDVSGWQTDYLVRLNQYVDSPLIKSGQAPKLDYLKLHGSFNWFVAPGANRTDLSNVYLVEENTPSKDLIHYRDIPVYIPMAYVKKEFFEGSLYNILWNMARRYLDQAEEVVFIGYGFPPTDIDNLFFFLNYKEKISEIVILDDTTYSKLNRLDSLFPKSSIINKDANEYIFESL